LLYLTMPTFTHFAVKLGDRLAVPIWRAARKQGPCTALPPGAYELSMDGLEPMNTRTRPRFHAVFTVARLNAKMSTEAANMRAEDESRGRHQEALGFQNSRVTMSLSCPRRSAKRVELHLVFIGPRSPLRAPHRLRRFRAIDIVRGSTHKSFPGRLAKKYLAPNLDTSG